MKSNYQNQIDWRFSKNLVPFEESLDFMENYVEKIIAGSKKEMIWILEHPPVYTAGVSAKEEDFIGQTSHPIIQTNRGGKYTYHCPGMKIVYVMLDLKKLFATCYKKPDIAYFVNFLEEWVIDLLSTYQIEGKIRKDRVGIWVEDGSSESKIVAIGIKVRKWVTYHGIAINVNPDLSGFNKIIPCGIKDFGITSIEKLGRDLDIDFNEQIVISFNRILNKNFS